MSDGRGRVGGWVGGGKHAGCGLQSFTFVALNRAICKHEEAATRSRQEEIQKEEDGEENTENDNAEVKERQKEKWNGAVR